MYKSPFWAHPSFGWVADEVVDLDPTLEVDGNVRR
jgi:hypothetical protein